MVAFSLDSLSIVILLSEVVRVKLLVPFRVDVLEFELHFEPLWLQYS